MASLPPPPVGAPSGSFAWVDWYRQLRDFLVGVGGTISWNSVSKTGANITDIPTRAHNTLQTLQGGAAGEFYHLTSAQFAETSAARSSRGIDTTDYVIIDFATKGLVLKDTQATPHYWKVTVSTLGVLTTTDLGTTKP